MVVGLLMAISWARTAKESGESGGASTLAAVFVGIALTAIVLQFAAPYLVLWLG